MFKMVNRSLKFKIAGLMVSVSLMLGLASLGIFHKVVRHQEDSQLRTFEAFSRNLSDAIAAQFFERYGDVQTFSISPALQSSRPETIVEALNAFGALYGIYDLILVVDSKGRLVSVNNKNPGGKPISTGVLYSMNFSDTPWFKAVMSGKTTDDKEKGFAGTFCEDVHIDPFVSKIYGENRLGTSFSTAIKDASGRIIGVVSNRASSRWFEVAFRESFAGLVKSGYKTGLVSLLDLDGVLLYEYSSANIDKLEDSKYNWDQLLKFNLAASGNLAARELLQRKGGASTQVNTRSGQLQVVGYSPVSGGKFVDSLGWGVIVRVSHAEAMASLNSMAYSFYAVLAAALLLSCLVGYLFSNNLSKRLSFLAETLTMGAKDVAAAALNISGSSQALSDAALKQAAAIQETAAAVDEVSTMAKKSADNSIQSQSASQRSRETAEQGQAAVLEMVRSIEEISQSNNIIVTQIEEGNRQISDIAKVISEIGTKTKVINDIVFQTKLLSFNASVEAARAGEHGKGFAVVAEEVGKLAQMSGNAAKEISTMLQSSIDKVESIVRETESRVSKLIVEGRGKVEVGTKTAKQCGEALTNILSTVQEVDTMVGEISSASHEQAQGVSEINKAINQLDQVTQTNSVAAQSSASSAQQLTSQSEQLQNIVNELSQVITGATASKVPVQSTAPAEGKVLPFQKTAQNKKKELGVEVARPRAAVGSGSSVATAESIPSKSDPRFKDV